MNTRVRQGHHPRQAMTGGEVRSAMKGDMRGLGDVGDKCGPKKLGRSIRRLGLFEGLAARFDTSLISLAITVGIEPATYSLAKVSIDKSSLGQILPPQPPLPNSRTD